MELKELVRRPLVTCGLDATLEQVAELMRRHNVGSIVVLDQHDRLCGIATDRDVFLRGGGAGTRTVDSVMSRDVVFAYEHDDVFDAATRLAERGCRRLPILDSNGAVTGIVTLDDLLVLFGREIDKLARAVGREVGAPVDARGAAIQVVPS